MSSFNIALIALLLTFVGPRMAIADQPFDPSGEYEVRYLDSNSTFKSKQIVRLEMTESGIKTAISGDSGKTWNEDGVLACTPIEQLPEALLLEPHRPVRGLRCQYVDAPPVFADHYYWFAQLPLGTKMRYEAPEWADAESKKGMLDEAINRPGEVLTGVVTDSLVHVIEIRGTKFPYLTELLRVRK